MRELGALDSAILRPQTGYYDGLIEQAAAMKESLSNNQPFIDGNKREAFYATDDFLRLNGHYIDCDGEEAYELFIGLFFIGLYEANSFRFANLVPRLKENVQRLS